MNSGVYKITNLVTKDCYIGSAKSFSKRWLQHKNQLKNGTHHNRYLLRAFNKVGFNNIKFEILFLCSNENLIFYEQRAIDYISPKYNLCKVAGSSYGLKRSVETLKRMSIAASRSLTGKKRAPFTDEHKHNLSLAKLGKKLSFSTRNIMMASQQKRRKREGWNK